MIRFRVKANDGSQIVRLDHDTVFLGLSDGNLTRLRAGQPIRIASDDAIGLGVELVLFHGATEVDMTRELEDKGFLPFGSTKLAEDAMAVKGEVRFEGGQP